MTIHELIASSLKIPTSRVSDDTSMKNTPEWDSLKHMELILAIEEHYKITLTGDEIADMVSAKAITDILKKHGV